MGMRLTYCTCIVAMYTGSDLHGLNHLNRDHVLRVPRAFSSRSPLRGKSIVCNPPAAVGIRVWDRD